jgi:hypothetical protein
MTAIELADRLNHEREIILRIDAEHAGEMLRKQDAAIKQLREAIIGLRDQPDWHEPGTPEPWDLADQALAATEELK